MKIRRVVLALGIALLTGAAGQGPVDEPSGYRMEEYRAATPVSLQGATVLDTDAAHALWLNRQAAFVDVLPRPPRPAGLPASTLWRPKPRFDIPGSIWLPDTGYGELAALMEQYFRTGLERASTGDRNRMLVFYCLENCWMSWNAAKRAIALGYSSIGWYRDGTDGWERQGLPLEPRDPLPRSFAGE